MALDWEGVSHMGNSRIGRDFQGTRVSLREVFEGAHIVSGVQPDEP